MSGICGILTFTDHPPEQATLERMAQHLRPADHPVKTFIDGPCGLAVQSGARHHLLTAAHTIPSFTLQADEATTHMVSIAFEGEIYDHVGIAKALDAHKHQFDSEPPHPAETIARSYMQYGAAHFVKPLHGQFAFALWDHARQQLLIARDQLGHNPLYYVRLPNALVFASSIQAVCAHPDVSKQPNLNAFPFFLTVGHSPIGETLFQGIKPVPPASIMTARAAENQRTTAYWLIPTADTPINKRSEGELSAELVRRIEGIVATQVQGFDKVGIYLEGGLSSAVILAVLARMDPNTVITFSSQAAGGIRSEEAVVIRKIRARFATQHQELPLPEEIGLIVGDMLTYYDEPFGDPTCVIAYIFTQLIADHVSLLMVGNGGDELFAGYDDFRIAQIAQQYDRLPDIAQRAIGEAIERLPTRQGFPRRLSQVTATASLSLSDRYLDWVRIFDEQALTKLVGKGGTAMVSRQYADILSEEEPDNLMAALLEIALRTDIPYGQMVRLYKSSQAAGLPIRTPFLDHRLVSFAAGLSPSLKLKRGTSRYILRQAFADILPRRVLESRREHGLPAPVNAWFRGGLAAQLDHTLLGEHVLLGELFDTSLIRDMIHAHRAEEADLGQSLWALFILERWMRHHFA